MSAPARHRTEPDLAGDRPARPGPAGLDAHARPDRQNPQVGNPPSPAPPLLRRRPDHHRPPPAPEIRTPLTLDRRDHLRLGTARNSPEPRLTSAFPTLQPAPPPPEPWNPAPTRRDSRAISVPTTDPNNRNGPPKKPTDRHERSRLAITVCGGFMDGRSREEGGLVLVQPLFGSKLANSACVVCSCWYPLACGASVRVGLGFVGWGFISPPGQGGG